MDTNTPVWPSALPTPLLNRAHRFYPRPEVTRMESGRLRRRRLFVGSVELIDVEWRFTQDEFDAFRSFFNTDLENGTLVFVLNTLEWTSDVHALVPEEVSREVAFWGAYSFARSDGLFAVAATLEVRSTERVSSQHYTITMSDSIALSDSVDRSVGEGVPIGGDDVYTGLVVDAMDVFDGLVASLGDTIVPEEDVEHEEEGWLYRPSSGGGSYIVPQVKAFSPTGEFIMTATRFYGRFDDMPHMEYDMHWNEWWVNTAEKFCYRKKFGPYATDVLFRVDFTHSFDFTGAYRTFFAETWLQFHSGDPGNIANAPLYPPIAGLPYIHRKVSNDGPSPIITDYGTSPEGATGYISFTLNAGDFVWVSVVHDLRRLYTNPGKSTWDFNFSYVNL